MILELDEDEAGVPRVLISYDNDEEVNMFGQFFNHIAEEYLYDGAIRYTDPEDDSFNVYYSFQNFERAEEYYKIIKWQSDAIAE